MAGLLWTELAERPNPDRWWSEMAKADILRRAYDARLWTVLDGATNRLSDLGVKVVTVKGITAQARWYRRTGERPCADLDLLLAPSDLPRVAEIVALLDPKNTLAADIDSLVRRGLLQSHDLVVEGITIDLHFDLFKLGIPARQRQLIWDRTQLYPVRSRDNAVRVLDPELALVHFLLHLNKDRFRYLLGFADIARILECEELDWSFVDQFLRAEGLNEPVWLALEAVLSTLSLPAPVRFSSSGWRSSVWRVCWRPAVRLQGELGAIRYRHRQDLLGLLAPGRFAEAAWYIARRRLVPARPLLYQWYPEIQGPYFCRLVRGRAQNIVSRLLATFRRWRSRAVADGPTLEGPTGPFK